MKRKQEPVFDPPTLKIMKATFDAAWASVEASGAPSASPAYSERAREIIARSILEAVKDGERDEMKLRDGALIELACAHLAKST